MIYAVDFDDTLNYTSGKGDFSPNKDLINFLKDKKFFILTARDKNESNEAYINKFLENNRSLKPTEVIFSNGKEKGPILEDRKADLLIDNSEEQRKSAKDHGIEAVHPNEISQEKIAKKERFAKIIKFSSMGLDIITDLTPEYIFANKNRDDLKKSWFKTSEDSHWCYSGGEANGDSYIGSDDAVRELISFLEDMGMDVSFSCEGHVMSDEEAEETFNQLILDQKKIRNNGLKLFKTEDKSKKVLFKNPNYKIPFNNSSELVKQKYSGHISFTVKDKDVQKNIFEKISNLSKKVIIEAKDDIIDIYIKANSQKKQKELWGKVTKIIKNEVGALKKETRIKWLKNLFKKASDLKGDLVLESPEDVYSLLKDTPDPKIYLDNPMGSKKGFGDRKRKLPFDYGEFSDWINPADEMGWDIIIPPSNREQTNLVQVGIVKVNPDKKVWKEKANKKPPVGNDKIIVASNGKITKKDKQIIEDFFYDMWQFKEVIWFGETKKEARKKRISFFRTNLDYGERESRLKNDAKDYNSPREGEKRWSVKYKKDIDCSNPKGFSQKQYCKRKKRGGDYKK